MKLIRLIKPVTVALLLATVFLWLSAQDSVVNAQSEAGKVEPLLIDNFTTEGSADFIIRFTEQADLSAAYGMDWNSRGEFVYNTLRETADKSQANAKAILDKAGLKYQTLIGGNDLYVWSGTPALTEKLAALGEVYYIRATRTYSIDPVEFIDPNQSISWAGDYLAKHHLTTVNAETDATTDWGISDTKANQAWGLGARGAGMKVANIDTGVQWNHPALVGQFACVSGSDPDCWADPNNICGGTACDNSGHGTHTMGTMVAKDNPALPYIAGMAPDATWIACKGCETSNCSSYALTSCADWVLAPGGHPAKRPNVVNNSWGGGSGNIWYQTYVNSWRAAGIFPAFSAGNSGPTCGTTGSPGDYQASFASAAHASNRTIASFSSRGPSAFGHSPYTKPNISAPGVSICSTVPTNSWNCSYSGTSMASPHTAGAVAQLWSCAPELVGQVDATFQALQINADTPPGGSCGAPPDGQGNYTYGYGYLDVLNLVTQNCSSPEPDISLVFQPLHLTLLSGKTGTMYIQIENLGNVDLIWSAADDAGWLGELPTGGTLVPGDTTQVTVSFNSTGLTAGVYQANIVVSSNDPDHPEITLPATLTVVEPDIMIPSQQSLDMVLYPKETSTINFIIENIGTADLEWSATDNAAWLSEQPTGGVLIPGGSTEVLVTFNAGNLTRGNYSGHITVNSNDPDEPSIELPVNLTVLEPDINVTAPALEATLFSDQTFTLTMTIANVGSGNLNWSLSDGATWLSMVPVAGVIPSGSSTKVAITFASAGFAPGSYATDLVITSNDPDEAEIILPANLTVIESEADLVVEKNASANSLNVGKKITYTLFISNNGPQDATGVILTDTLPVLVSLLNAPPKCAESSRVISCDIGDLEVDSTVTITIIVTATGEGYAVNNAQVSSDFIDPDMTNNTDSVTIKINPKMVKLFIPFLQRH